ncbi:extracellular solute-binding protein [Microbacterium sp. BG28]|uniref:ABC transporter substrate-binding protein n=1 Tax=Microbacterium sp. BG28 TaxID=3097356 RepID=UPI002A5AB6C8|nr:extracellular solute-binding protein [Microbacterium sp. BG28]MDY0828500.1 extracellular solute-binding protein [Microbacterium sp. BG28]
MSPNTAVARRPRRSHRGAVAIAVAASAAAILTACAPPGSSGQDGPAAAATDVSTTLPSDPVKLQILTSQEAADVVTQLGQEFTRQNPTVTFDVVAEANSSINTNLSRILTRDTPPDILFTPALAQPARDGLLTNLDPYFDAYGWDSWSQELLRIARVSPEGDRGTGSLYAVGIGYNVTGIYYNKEIAAKVGLTAPPTTFDQFEKAATDAVAAGYLGVSLAAKDAGTPFLLQELQNAYGNAPEINDWIYQRPDATFDQPGMLAASQKLQEWTKVGAISPDALSVDYPTMMADFQAGKALYVPVGDWENARLTAAMGDNVGFFLIPPVDAGAKQYTMASPANYSIPQGAKNKDVAAYFLNWVQSNEQARKIVVDVLGSSPGGPVDLPVPPSDSPLVNSTLAAFQQVLADDGAVDFIANGSAAFTLDVLNPEMQALVLGSRTPQDFIDTVQAGYEKDLTR